MKRLSLLLIVLLLILGLGTQCLAAKEYHWKIGHVRPEGTAVDKDTKWLVEKINQDFQKGLEKIGNSTRKFNSLSPEQAFVEKMVVGGEIVSILFKDPLLPDIFLPKNWKGQELKEQFDRWIKALWKLSRPYWRKILL